MLGIGNIIGNKYKYGFLFLLGDIDNYKNKCININSDKCFNVI